MWPISNLGAIVVLVTGFTMSMIMTVFVIMLVIVTVIVPVVVVVYGTMLGFRMYGTCVRTQRFVAGVMRTSGLTGRVKVSGRHAQL